MKIYTVGGAVRDSLLGLPVQDRDYVVVGATPEDMVARGFTPVGKDFPVFLHPKTHEEYALARTERKTAPGYKGFVFHTDANVSLEEDLRRRDLTVNAIAQAEDGSLHDPFHGQRDIAARVFRHVSAAFAEDPVRILRVARFAARFADFTVAAETLQLMQQMVVAGEVDALVPERVWQELSRGLMEATPTRMFEVLRSCGALARILPELDAVWDTPLDLDAATHAVGEVPLLHGLRHAASAALSLPIRFAALSYAYAAEDVQLLEQVCQRLKIPNECRELAIMTVREHGVIQSALDLDAPALVKLFERCDGVRKPQRFIDTLHAVECVNNEYKSHNSDTAIPTFPQRAYLENLLRIARAIDAGKVAQQFLGEPQKIALAVHAARVAAVATAMAG